MDERPQKRTERDASARRPLVSREPATPELAIDDDISGSELSREARAELRTASKSASEIVSRHLVMAGRLIDDDPELAYAHARAARKYLPRLAVVREAMGLCAYANGSWAEALAELRASRRISGSIAHLPVMADCERGLGRPERALAIGASPEAGQLDRAGAVEMRIVVAGARRDMGQLDAAVVSLQGPDLDAARRDPWSLRLFYAYADSLLAAGRVEAAREWFVNAAVLDDDGETDATDRVAEIDDAAGVGTRSPAAPTPDGVSDASGDAAVAAGVIPGSSHVEATTLEPAKELPAQTELVLVFEEP